MTFLFSIPFLPNMQSPKSINVLGYNVIHITCCYLRKQHTCRENNFCYMYIEGVIYKAHQIKTTQHNNMLRLFTLTILLSLYQCFPSQLRKEIKRLCVVEWNDNWIEDGYFVIISFYLRSSFFLCEIIFKRKHINF